MNPSISKVLISHLEGVIAFVIAAAILIFANATRMPKGLASFLLMRITLAHVVLGILLLAAWQPCFRGFENAIKNRDPILLVFGQVIRGATIVSTLLAAILYTARVHTPAWPVLLCFWLASLMLVGSRVLFSRWVNGAPWRHHSQVLIVGTGPMARYAWREIRTFHHRSTKVVGFVDIAGPVDTYPEIVANYLGNVEDLEKLLLKTVVDTVVIALPAKSCYGAIETAVAVSERVGVDVVLNRVFQTAGGPHRLLDPYADDSNVAPYLLKRFWDVTFAVLAIVVLSSMFLIIGLLIKLTSPGPVFFSQERYGYRRRRFKMYKFRTMVAGAETMLPALESSNELQGPIFKMRHDPRVTPLGRFLRRTSLDELPQLWNVVMGTMSLVGPRPMSVRDVSLFSDSYLMRRFRVKPGITGLWQVSGRSSLSFDQWIDMDFRYIDNWSLKLDFSILLRTIPAVLKGSGAM